jgi:hypothetical protein
MHSIHGRAPAIATGLATSRPGPVGVGHHRRRRRPLDRWQPPHPRAAPQCQHHDPVVQQRDLRVDQGAVLPHLASPARSPSPRRSGRSTPRSTRCRLALGAEATFVARTMDSDRAHLSEILRAAAAHRGTALVEIYQNCPIFNDGAFDVLKDRTEAERGSSTSDGEPVAAGDQVVGPRRRQRSRSSPSRPPTRPDRRHRRHRAPVVGLRAVAVVRVDAVARADGCLPAVSRPAYDDLVRGQVERPSPSRWWAGDRRRPRRAARAAGTPGPSAGDPASPADPCRRTNRTHRTLTLRAATRRALRLRGIPAVGVLPALLPRAGPPGPRWRCSRTGSCGACCSACRAGSSAAALGSGCGRCWRGASCSSGSPRRARRSRSTGASTSRGHGGAHQRGGAGLFPQPAHHRRAGVVILGSRCGACSGWRSRSACRGGIPDGGRRAGAVDRVSRWRCPSRSMGCSRSASARVCRRCTG